MANPNGQIAGSAGLPIEIVDAKARQELAKKLTAPEGLKIGMLLKVKDVTADGSVVLEGVTPTEGGELPTDPNFNSVQLGGDSGVVAIPEGTAEAPALTLYGANGDEAVQLNNVADATDDRGVPNLGQVKQLIENGEGSGENAGVVWTSAAVAELLRAMRKMRYYEPCTATIDALEALLTQGSTAQGDVYQVGNATYVINPKTVVQEGSAVYIT